MQHSSDEHRRDLAIPITLTAAGILLFVCNITVAYLLFARPAMGGSGFQSPGSVVIPAESPGTWTVFHEVAGTFEGRRHQSGSPDSRGLTISVSRLDDGSPVVFEPDSSFTMSVGSRTRVTAGRFMVDRPGEYRVEAAGHTKPIVLYVTEWSTSVPLIHVAMLACVQITAFILAMMGVRRLMKQLRGSPAHTESSGTTSPERER